ncbi:hypothetical protein LUZ60_005384 [Juncus effusus]|nr:hypothetical protein LUZ60_005384 [Juncus effusus]
MDVQANVSVSSGFLAPWDFSPETNKENDDSSLEWLSIYVEDCLSSAPTTYYTQTQIKPDPKPSTPPLNPNPNPNPNSDSNQTPSPTHQSKSEIKKRKRTPSIFEEPPLLHNQTQWLADSEPFYPLTTNQKPVGPNPNPPPKKKKKAKNILKKASKEEKAQRRCTHCLSNKTPQWREGPMGPKTLCNACGVRFKSGRLLPEYRPAKSPTFESFKHSNSHRKVMEMRMMATMGSDGEN